MADKKITALTALTAPIGADLIHVIDDVASTPVNKKMTLDSLFNNMPSWLAFDSTPQAISTSVAVDITSAVTTIATGGGGIAGALADGAIGQLKVITMITDGGGNYVCTPATLNGYATLTFADDGDSVVLMWVAVAGWCIIANQGVALA